MNVTIFKTANIYGSSKPLIYSGFKNFIAKYEILLKTEILYGYATFWVNYSTLC